MRRSKARELEMQTPANESVDRKQQPLPILSKLEPLLPQGKWSQRRKAAIKRIGIPTTLIGILTAFLSFFPHLTISDPVTMDSSQLFSKYLTITNDGILPVFRVRCGLTLGTIHLKSGITFASDTKLAATIAPVDCYAGTLSPGDGYTFTTEHTFVIPTPEAADADFAVIVSYIPILPPVRMDKCVHFVMHRDSAGRAHWFRSPRTCALFPWLNH